MKRLTSLRIPSRPAFAPRQAARTLLHAPPARVAPLLATLPALLMGAALWAVGPSDEAPPALPVMSRPGTPGELPRVALANTMVVKRELLGGSVVLRGHVRMDGVVVNGRAGVSGMVSRLWAQDGQMVRRGQPVMQISGGVATRPAPRIERGQTRAEQAQVEAARAQEALDARIMGAQQRLVAARQRVQRAQAGVVRAREIVQHLQQQGDAPQGAPAEIAPVEPPAPSAPAASGEKRAAERERDTLTREARRAQEEADSAASKAEAASREAARAEGKASAAKGRIAETQAKSKAVQAAFDAGGAKGSEVEAARAAVEDATTEAAEAATQAAVARREADQLKASAATRRARVAGAQERAVAALRKLELFADEPAPPRRAPSRTPRRPREANSRAAITVAQAAQMVNNALNESEAALADAHRIKREVDSYPRQVSSTKERIDSSSRDLQSAQDRVLAHSVRSVLRSVYAPVTGRVVRVARLTQSVGPGDAVITIGQGGGLEARFADTSGVWRTLSRGITLPALLASPTPAAPLTSGAAPASAGSPALPPHAPTNPAAPAAAPRVPASPARGSAAPAAPRGIVLTLRVRAVQPPAQPGAPAIVTAGLESGGQPLTTANATLGGATDGAGVLCSVPKPGVRAAIRVPLSALWRGPDGRTRVAVLQPQPAAPALMANSAPPSATAPSAMAPVPADAAQQPVQVEWRLVRTGHSDGVLQEIVSGLQPDERIALDPTPLAPATSPAQPISLNGSPASGAAAETLPVTRALLVRSL